MKYTCYFCGKEFDSYHGDSEFMTRQYDQVRIQFKPKFDPKNIYIADYKCCPDCIGKVIMAIENLKITKTIHDHVLEFANNIDENIRYVNMRFGDQPININSVFILEEKLKGDSE